jgi:micrococcal nuclease
VKRRRPGRLNIVSLVLFLAASIFYFVHEKYPVFTQSKEDEPFLQVKEVHDGDTVTIIVGGRPEKVRLIGIDAPEMGQKPWGRKSRDHLESLISDAGWKVRVETDVEERDKYGRLLGYLWSPEGTHLNLVMLQNGYALLYTFPPNVKYVDEFRSAQREAREQEIGIWSQKGLREKPSDYRRSHPRK